MRGNDARLPQSVLFSRVPLGVAHSLGGIHRVFLRSEEHTSELQSRLHLVCRLLLEKKNEPTYNFHSIQGVQSAERDKGAAAHTATPAPEDPTVPDDHLCHPVCPLHNNNTATVSYY